MWKQKAKSVCGGSTTGRSYFSTKRFSRLAKIVKGLRGRIERSEAADCEEKFSRIQEGLRKSVFEGTLELINFTKKTGKLNEMEMEWFVGEKKKIIDVIKEIAIRMLAVFEEHASADLDDWLNRGLAIELVEGKRHERLSKDKRLGKLWHDITAHMLSAAYFSLLIEMGR
ncbi:hypothetical protein Pst134EB_012798 [Puccinia striiformis f. sp. tritici]|uniref:Uncharacterized protein n=1 Tax=Puccinia striiformis f. sp. tritici PST-78 TaxID=1165861 RepID=A0A0L0UUL2_9BASI|nr:hypothetical protein Pst134EB_012798 [Puccinia striiformis f. sp. tritici]KNE90723.1 hypothetical protein PSTG_15829 [Puccinia striiformis f. sp. tritici PST-78]